MDLRGELAVARALWCTAGFEPHGREGFPTRLAVDWASGISHPFVGRFPGCLWKRSSQCLRWACGFPAL
eukprot:15467195-Alexandrium_andersonii.AAC.1